MAWFDYPTNFSNGTNSVTGIGSLAQYSSEVTGGAFGYVLLSLITIITMFSLGADKKAFAASFFVSFLLSIYLVNLSLISPAVPILLIIMTVISLLVNLGSNNN